MDLFEAVSEVEDPTTEEAWTRALQALINAGVWSLQGHIGREMMAAIEAGHCALGHQPASDYWGNLVPARGMIEPGAMGSAEFVEAESPFGGVLE